MTLRYWTAGESHGKTLLAVVDGFPAGVQLDTAPIDVELRRRQGGYGRGGRQRIETDTVELLTGVWHNTTLGSPIGLQVVNKDYKLERLDDLTRPRPGHGDLTGAIKYLGPIRGILERASAGRRRCASPPVRCAGNCSPRSASRRSATSWSWAESSSMCPICRLPSGLKLRDASEIYSLDPARDEEVKRLIDETGKAGDTLGGIVEVRVEGIPFGLGTHAQWDLKLDGRIAQAVMAVQAIKGVEIGLGFEAARRPGSQVHDADSLRRIQAPDADAGLRAADEQRRRAGSGHDQRPAAGRAGREEADQHAPQAAGVGEPRDEAARVGGVRAERRVRGFRRRA